ncbi:MAG: alpha-ribazole phosphatase [Chloroflexi bacterium]|nr:MAG: alpha-ribazole phosphatase [Chloroflexota bacterium]
MPINLFLARHGETELNAAYRFQGQSDPELNQTGLNQARFLAERLSVISLDRIISSDLRRAQSTAEIICERNICPLRIDSDLREISFGSWEGLTYAEIQALDPQALNAWETDWISNSPPGGENLLSLEKRMQGFLEHLKEEMDSSTILIVSHGGPLQVLICLALGLPIREYWKFQISTASLSEIHLTKEWASLKSLNDTCYLKKCK